MKSILRLIAIIFSLSLVACGNTEDSINDNQKNIPTYGENTLLLKERLETLYDENLEYFLMLETSLSQSVQINSVTTKTTNYSTLDAFDLQDLYYFREYNALYGDDYWIEYRMLGDDLVGRRAIEDVLYKERLAPNVESLFAAVGNPYEIFDLFFETIDYQHISQNEFQIYVPFDKFIQDPLVKDLLGDAEFEDSITEDIMVYIDFLFTSNSVDVVFQYTLHNSDDISITIDVEFTGAVWFPNSISRANIDESDYYIETDNTISEDMIIYTKDDEPLLYLESDAVVKFYLEPGFYHIDYSEFDARTSYVQNELSQDIYSYPLVIIPEAGYYYIHISPGNFEHHRMQIQQMNETTVGTPDNPIYEEPIFSGRVTEGSYTYHLLDIDTNSEYVKVTILDTTYTVMGALVGNGLSSIAHAVLKNYVSYFAFTTTPYPYLYVYGTMSTNYTLQYETMPYSKDYTDISQMPSTKAYTVRDVINPDIDFLDGATEIVVGGNHLITQVRFFILEEGYYNISLYGSDVYSVDGRSPNESYEIYNSAGEMIGSAQDMLYYTTGTYYIELTWMEGGFAFVSVSVYEQMME
jgi:hypothetical protein